MKSLILLVLAALLSSGCRQQSEVPYWAQLSDTTGFKASGVLDSMIMKASVRSSDGNFTITRPTSKHLPLSIVSSTVSGDTVTIHFSSTESTAGLGHFSGDVALSGEPVSVGGLSCFVAGIKGFAQFGIGNPDAPSGEVPFGLQFVSVLPSGKSGPLTESLTFTDAIGIEQTGKIFAVSSPTPVSGKDMAGALLRSGAQRAVLVKGKVVRGWDVSLSGIRYCICSTDGFARQTRSGR